MPKQDPRGLSNDSLNAPLPEGRRGWQGLPYVEVDEIFGVDNAFKRDPRPEVKSPEVPLGQGKMNLSLGVFVGDYGNLHVCDAITAARGRRYRSDGVPSPYLNQVGYGPLIEGVNRLIYGAESSALKEGRVATVQSVGGGNALFMGGLSYKESLGGATPQILLSEQSWANHPKIFGRLRFEQRVFKEFDQRTRSFDGSQLLAAVDEARSPVMLLLQPSCANPTGNRPSAEFWRTLCEGIRRKADQGVDITVFFDVAYQGFGESVEADIEPVRLFTEAGISTMTAWSGSKSFSLYGSRVGALSVVAASPGEAALVQANLCEIVRSVQSNCPRDGAELVGDVLSDPMLYDAWNRDLARLRSVLRQRRELVATEIERELPGFSARFIREGQGFFSQLGLDEGQAAGFRADGIYMPMQGRIAFPLIGYSNVRYFARSFASRMTEGKGTVH